jgi:hypothetical protein
MQDDIVFVSHLLDVNIRDRNEAIIRAAALHRNLNGGCTHENGAARS